MISRRAVRGSDAVSAVLSANLSAGRSPMLFLLF
jgi:hypothetical protein